jgi:hypothetical protein
VLGFASVLLGKTLRSSTLKLAFIYVIVFSSAIFAVLGYVYWATVTFVSKNLDRSISVERALLIKAYDSAERTSLTTLINRRVTDPFFDEWAYLLTDPSLHPIAGNLKSWPTTLHGNQGWGKFRPLDWQVVSGKFCKSRCGGWSWHAGDIAITGSFGEDAHHDQEAG